MHAFKVLEKGYHQVSLPFLLWPAFQFVGRNMKIKIKINDPQRMEHSSSNVAK
jgi:hypothetical protein